MKPLCYRQAARLFQTALVVLTFLISLPIRADSLKVHQTQAEAIAVQRQTQQDMDDWTNQKTAMKNRYLDLVSKEKDLQRKKSVLEEQIRILQTQQAEAERKIAESAMIREKLQSHLDAVIERLEQTNALSLPFLADERATRIDALKHAMIQPDAGAAEKCRRVMEALKIETEYGQTVEVYQEAIRIDGQSDDAPIVADILRIGRLALFWRTPDSKRVGHWDRAGGKWAVLPDTYRRHINDATEMALKRRTIDIVKLPLGRIVAQ